MLARYLLNRYNARLIFILPPLHTKTGSYV